ncbi:MAG: NERD domain-containing protein [Chitinophagaceae bacterium]|nr:NERD domain-containing protein [Chitinophagaceae bacterium]
MCNIHNQVGSLTSIKTRLHQEHIHDFKSINELLTFQRNYTEAQKQIHCNHTQRIEEEKATLEEVIEQLQVSIEKGKEEIEQRLHAELNQLKQELSDLKFKSSSILETWMKYFKKIWMKSRIWRLEKNFNANVEYFIQAQRNALSEKSQRYQYITAYFSDAVKQSGSMELKELERRKSIIDELNSTILGAIGEQKVAKELEHLSDDYHLINDFTCTFNPPIYKRQTEEYITSIQIDHILVSPAGIFMIETKNWSEQSLNNLSLRSPVEQIQRSSYALYKILNTDVINSLNKHHWGERKIPIRNLIVLINQKPNEEFQYVKILTLKELRNYVAFFKPVFSNDETALIAKYLLGVNG